MALINKLTAIADSIREKTGKEDLLTLDQMPLEIAEIQTGVELGFEVVGGTVAPASPSENMIWINTDVEITNWYFSTDESDITEEGIVWIKIYKYSTVEFNILKENGVYVRPLCAKQYISGAWVDKTAKTYQNSEWVDWWNGELYLAGNEFTDITGGWRAINGSFDESNNIVTRTEEGIKMSFVNNSRRSGYFATRKPIDLTDFNTVTFKGYIYKGVATTSGKEAYGYLYVYNDISNGSMTQVARAKIPNDGKIGTVTIDVSNLSGPHSICPNIYSFDSTKTPSYLVMNSLILS